MSHPARLSLRAPPHLPFIQGWPGIPSSSNRSEAGVHGTVEVRIGPTPIKAKWVRVEIRKFESLPPGFPGSISQGETWEHVGEISNLWKAADGKECDDLEQADFKFYLPLPEMIPPSVEMAKGTGVRYELVAALCYRQKGGLFKKEAYPIMKISEALRITKHELHSAWPLYNVPDSKSGAGPSGEVGLVVQRPGCAFGPTDRILLTATLRSSRPKPFKLKGFDCTLHEIITAHPSPSSPTSTKSKKGKSPSQPVTKSKVVATTRCAVDETVGRGGEKSARIDMAIPAEKLLVTVKHARSLEVEYELEVKAVCADGVQEVKVGGIRYVVGTFARGNAQQAVRDIGHVDDLCPAPPGMLASNPQSRVVSSASLPTSDQPGFTPSPRNSSGHSSPGFSPQQPGFPPQQSQQRIIQGFIPTDPRRKSSTSTVTTTTTMAQDFNPFPTVRPYSTLPNQRTGNVAFPTPNPAAKLVRSATMKTVETSMISPGTSASGHGDRYSESEAGHGDDSMRYSTNTTATFGKWDKGLKTALNLDDSGTLMSVSEASPTTPTSSRPPDHSATVSPSTDCPSTPPVSRPTPAAYPNAEQEKVRLYNSARSRAAASQSATGVSLDQIGLDDLAPPEYAPPRPALPNGEYRAPERPVSVYTDGTVSPSMSNAETFATGMADVSGSRLQNGSTESQYMTAAEEKEAQKKRFETAANRVVSAGSRSNGPSPLTSATTSPNPGTSSFPPNSATTPDESPVPYEAIFPNTAASSSSSIPPGTDSGLGEKEEMRRYYEAQDKVNQVSNRNVSGGSQGQGGPSSHGVVEMRPISDGPSAVSRVATPANDLVLRSRGQGSGAQTSNTVHNGLNEKEQMKRYYEAQDKVNQVSNRVVSDGITPGTIAESVPLSEGSKPIARVATPANELVLKSRGEGRNNILTGLSEKEQMRRYYEAQDRVNQGGSSSKQIASADPSAQAITSSLPVTSPSAPPIEGLSEKEQMRRYYEAQDKVHQQSSGSVSNDVPPPPPDIPTNDTSLPTTNNTSLPTPPATSPAKSISNGLSEKEQMRRYYEAQDRVAQSSQTGSSSSINPNPSPNTSRIAQPPVNNREEQMKRYYEAMERVARHSASTSGSGPPTSPPRVTSPTQSINGYFSAEQEKEMMRKRFEDAQAAVSRSSGGGFTASPPESPLVRDPTIRAGKARALVSPVGEGPPPPLPAKPPLEYINLLSPVEEVDRQLGGGGAGLGIGGGMGMAPLGSVLGEDMGRGGASRAGSRNVSGSSQIT